MRTLLVYPTEPTMKTCLLTKIYDIAVKTLDAFFPRKNNFTSGLKKAYDINYKRLCAVKPYSYIQSNKYCLLPYSDEIIKNLMWRFKYHRNAEATNFFANIMADELISLFSDTLNFSPISMPTFVAYCPSSSYASGKKEWDHMKELTLLLEKRCTSFQPHLYICIDALEVNGEKVTNKQNVAGHSDMGEIKQQHTGTRKERITWAKNKYRLSLNFKNHLQQLSRVHQVHELNTVHQVAKNVHIICIDDIYTTGATMQAALTALEAIPTCKTTAITLCFTEAQQRRP